MGKSKEEYKDKTEMATMYDDDKDELLYYLKNISSEKVRIFLFRKNVLNLKNIYGT